MTPSLYIHIPFCTRKCIYCNFYSDIYDPRLASSYIDVLSAQIDKIHGPVSTIYMGGGTPTSIENRLLEKLLKRLSVLARGTAEFTVEANPESLDDGKLKILRGNGVDRLSIGVQSLRDEKLKKIGRLHNAHRALDSIHLARKAGFENISADLIFGVWDESLGSWEKELKEAARLPVTHISCYELTYEPGTPLGMALLEKSVKPQDDDVTAKMYEEAIEILSLGGFKQYEVSNFAKSGYECRHNLNYWNNDPYIGLGASAVSYIDGIRKRLVSNAAEYIKRYEANKDLAEFEEKLPPEKKAKETAAVKIRTKDGIDFEWFNKKTGFDFQKLEERAIKELIEKDLIKYKKDGNLPTGIILKRKGFLFCDTVSSTLL